MKSKKTLYLLLIVVVVVWGLIIYKIIGNLSFSTGIQQNSTANIKQGNEQLKLDSFTIQANYRDPFLNIQLKPAEHKPVLKTGIVKKTVVQEKITITSIKPNHIIIYKGLITNQASKSSLAMISIDGTDKMMRDKETFKDLTLLKISKDSILIGTSNGNFYIKRK